MNMNCQRCYKVGRIIKIPVFQLFELKSIKSAVVNGRTIACGVAAADVVFEDDLSTADDATDSSHYARLLQFCINNKALGKGKSVHAQIISLGMESDTFLLNNLVNMYSKCGNVAEARQVFDQMSERNSVSWNAVIAGYVQHGNGFGSLTLFSQMHREGVKPTHFTFASVVKACGNTSSLSQALQDMLSMGMWRMPLICLWNCSERG